MSGKAHNYFCLIIFFKYVISPN